MTANTAGYDLYDEEPLPQAVIDAKPGEVVTAADGREKHTVWLDGEMIGVVFDESLAKLERGAFAAWSPKCRNKGGIVGFYATLGDAADAIADKPAKPVAGDVKEWSGTRTHFNHMHRFGANGRALCNSRIWPHVWPGPNDKGVILHTREEIEADEYAHLHTFCPRCEAKH